MKTIPIRAPDWVTLFADMRAAGLSIADIGKRINCQFTDRMIYFYGRGVQPLHWRGEAIIGLWLATTGKTRDNLPMVEIVTNYRRAGRSSNPVGTFSHVTFPDWPVVKTPENPVEVSPAGKRRGRPPKVKAAA